MGIKEPDEFKKYIKEKFNYELKPWDFVITNDKIRDLAYCYNPNKGIERIDNIPETSKIRIKNAGIIEPKDIYQKCAAYAMKESDASLITGRFGSGKTLIATAMALNQSKRKIFITRPPIGISSAYDIGFLPGSKDEKMLEWAGGFLSALNYIYKDAKGLNYDSIKTQLFFEKFEIIPLNMIQGISILENEILIVDEVQLITREYMSMILSRMSEGSKLFLLGDIYQTYSTISKQDSGLYRLQQLLPHEALAWVELKNIYRNKLTELAMKLTE
ncbi:MULTISPECIES: PhoH family protein [unclassified Lebetimonas]|uniref:PhoH family protein n=1 Tax=unclassified Lebetimonas TaxID=2648158 RepID=UPI000464C2DF|nr:MULTISPECIES: PhoH family protein [unclassified Lebetimonas]